MSWRKAAFVVAVLAALSAGVYVALKQDPESPPPPGIAGEWTGPPEVEVPDATTSEFPFSGSAGVPASDSSPGGPGSLNPGPWSDEPQDTALSGRSVPPFSPTSVPGDIGRQGVPPGLGADLPLATQTAALAEPPIDGSNSDAIRRQFVKFMQAAYEELEQGNLAKVHEDLSAFYDNPRFYDNPQLTPEEQRQITDLLDQLAATVVYSREHLLEPPYTVKPGDTLETIARAYGVPWRLLAKINGIRINGVRNPESLEPGQQLKVVRGPFDAVIRLGRHDLTMMLGTLYAGRFQIGIGSDQQVGQGTYYVDEKVVRSDDRNGPPGRYWIKLDEQIGIHGASDPRQIGASGGPGSISLGEKDLEDVHDILSIGSRVQILR